MGIISKHHFSGGLGWNHSSTNWFTFGGGQQKLRGHQTFQRGVFDLFEGIVISRQKEEEEENQQPAADIPQIKTMDFGKKRFTPVRASL